MRNRLFILALLFLFAFNYTETPSFEVEVCPSDTFELNSFIEGTIGSTLTDTFCKPESLITTITPLSRYEELNLTLENLPLGRFDGTGFNYIIVDSTGNDIGVIFHPDFSSSKKVDTVWIAKPPSIDPKEEDEFPLVNKPIDFSVSEKKQLAYINKYKSIAKEEEERTGIPAAITLAQGVLESAQGESYLARNANNHFGIKCFSKRCKKGHCLNRTDDSHKDYFLKFKTIEDSFVGHSNVFKKKRYSRLFALDKSNLKGWAYGLGPKTESNPGGCGYATSKKYGFKIMQIINKYNLHEI